MVQRVPVVSMAPAPPPAPPPVEVSFEEKVLGTIPEDRRATEISFSPVGAQVAYIGVADGKEFVVVGDTAGEPFGGTCQ